MAGVRAGPSRRFIKGKFNVSRPVNVRSTPAPRLDWPHEDRNRRAWIRRAAARRRLRRGGPRGRRPRRRSQRASSALAHGESDIEDVPSERARARSATGFTATDRLGRLEACDAILICVPTPLAEPARARPDLHDRRRRGARRRARSEGQLVVLESTTYPGHDPRGAAADPRGVRPARPASDFHLAYLAGADRPGPHRPHDPHDAEGRRRHDRRPAPSAPSPLYAEICDEVVARLLPRGGGARRSCSRTSSARSTSRSSTSSRSSATASASTSGRSSTPPRRSRSASCASSRDRGWAATACRSTRSTSPSRPASTTSTTEFVELAGKINQSQPLFCVEQDPARAQRREKPVKGSRVLVLGVAYKSGVGDLREAPALKIIAPLRELGAEVAYHDPHVPALADQGLESVELDAAAAAADAVGDRHRPRRGRLRTAWSRGASLVVDFRGVTRSLGADNVVLL